MKGLLVFILFAAYSTSYSQKQGVKFESVIFDYGEVSQWNNPGAAFVFTNTSSNEIIFLPTFKRDDIFAELPKGKIKVGETGTVFIYYFTSSTGEFQKSLELFTSGSNIPVKLTVKGNILSLDPKAFISCPGFAPKIDRTDDLALLLDSLSPQSQSMNEGEVMVFEKMDGRKMPTTLASVDDGILPMNQYAPNNIVFLIDVSLSMKRPNKLPLLKISMKNLTNVLRRIDYISVITYSTASTVMLTPTVANNKGKIISLIDTLTTSGTTNGVKGLQAAYDIAEQNLIQDGNNQIIIATDGLFNSPKFSESDLYYTVKQKAKQGIILSVIGFGQDEDALKMMRKMADKGTGSLIQIPDRPAANEILIEEIKLQSAIVRN